MVTICVVDQELPKMRLEIKLDLEYCLPKYKGYLSCADRFRAGTSRGYAADG